MTPTPMTPTRKRGSAPVRLVFDMRPLAAAAQPAVPLARRRPSGDRSRACERTRFDSMRYKTGPRPALFRRPRRGKREAEPCREGVRAEGPYRRKRELLRAPGAERGQLVEHLGGGGDDMAAHRVGLHDVEDLPRRSPDDRHVRRGARAGDGLAHEGAIVDAEIGEPTG